LWHAHRLLVVRNRRPSEHEPFLREVDPNQDYEAYVATRKTVGRDIDVRLYGVDVDRFEDDTPEATA